MQCPKDLVNKLPAVLRDSSGFAMRQGQLQQCSRGSKSEQGGLRGVPSFPYEHKY